MIQKRRPDSTWTGLCAFACCFVIAMFEGFDIQLVGVAGAQLAGHFGFAPNILGLMFSASLLGLFLGALLGGRCEARWGAARVLTASMCAFGAMTVATAFAWDGFSLIGFRLCTGVGLGAAMPNLILVVTRTAPETWRRTLTTLLWAGTPIGGILVAQCGAAGLSWRTMFAIGGLLPMLCAPIVMALITDHPSRPRARCAAQVDDACPTIAAPSRWVMVAAGTCFFCTLLALYTLLNWLPILLRDLGLTPAEAAQGAAIFNSGGLAGALLLGVLLRFLRPAHLLPFIYAAFVIALLLLALPSSSSGARLVAVGTCGLAVIGGQYALYGVVGTLYPVHSRTRGVTMAVASGRLGALIGPLLAGLVLQVGLGSQLALLSLAPIAIIAGLASYVMTHPLSVKRKPTE